MSSSSVRVCARLCVWLFLVWCAEQSVAYYSGCVELPLSTIHRHIWMTDQVHTYACINKKITVLPLFMNAWLFRIWTIASTTTRPLLSHWAITTAMLECMRAVNCIVNAIDAVRCCVRRVFISNERSKRLRCRVMRTTLTFRASGTRSRVSFRAASVCFTCIRKRFYF